LLLGLRHRPSVESSATLDYFDEGGETSLCFGKSGEIGVSGKTIDEIIKFWFGLDPKQWYRRDEKLDAEIAARFGDIYAALKGGVPESWLQSPQGFLAAVIVLDQLPRNMFRGSARAFATDGAALALAKRASEEGVDAKLPPVQRAFLYMPFQHAEDEGDQARSVGLFTALGNPDNLDFAQRHKAIIDRFGRFPHRNETLGRESTPEEREFLKQPGSSF
jgi:uncharacterized protein (DUF924 family)